MSRVLHRTPVLPAAVAFLLTTATAEAGWRPPSPGATAAGGAVAVGVAYSLRRNLGESAEQFGEVLGAALRGDTEEVKRLSEEFDRLPGKLVRDSFPVLKGVSRAVDTSRAAAARLKEKVRATERRIRRLVGTARGTALDARAALAIDEDEREWYESKIGILDSKPLPVVSVPRPPDTSAPGTAAPVEDAWADLPPGGRIRGSNPVGEYAMRCAGVEGVGPYSVYYSYWEQLMEKHAGECPTDDPYQSAWSTVLNEGSEPDPWAPEQEELPTLDGLPVKREMVPNYQEDGTRYEKVAPDYRTELAALERRQAEAERRQAEAERRQAEAERRQAEAERLRRESEQAAAEEARRQEEAEARAEAKRERLESQRRAAKRERRALERELAAARSSQYLRDSINQGIQMLDQQLQELQELREIREKRRAPKSNCWPRISRSCGDE